MTIDLAWIKRGAVAAALVFGAQISNAAGLGLTAVEPDIATSGAAIDYTFSGQCEGIQKGIPTGTYGACGTSSGSGGNAINYTGALNESLSSGLLSITGSGNFTTTMDEAGTVFGFLTGATYDLSASFNGDGTFSSGTIEINYAGTFDLSGNGFGSEFTSGTAVDGTITDFGFSEAAGAAGSFEFLFDLVSPSDFYDNLGVYFNAGSIATSFDLVGYDAGFQQDFSGTANVDTFVPVPAAVWMFGSGLIGLAGWARRRKA